MMKNYSRAKDSYGHGAYCRNPTLGEVGG